MSRRGRKACGPVAAGPLGSPWGHNLEGLACVAYGNLPNLSGVHSFNESSLQTWSVPGAAASNRSHVAVQALVKCDPPFLSS